jgi:pilus assembly protein CpaF
MELTVRAIREQIASAVDLIVHQSRMKDGSRRITHVSEVIGMEGDVITLQDIFVFDYRAGIDENGRFRGIIQPTGLRPRFLDRLIDQGVHFEPELFQHESGAVPLAMRR